MPKRQLTLNDYQAAAERLKCEPAVLQAVAHVESSGLGFLNDGRCKVLFEGHVFYRETKGRYAHTDPSLCYPHWTRAHYATGESAEDRGAGEIARLERAMKLDRIAALRSASYGRFQIMGFNHRACMYPDVGIFYQAMQRDAASHLDAFCHLIKSMQLTQELRDRDWTAFARAYNGPAYRENDYDGKLARAYERFTQYF